MKNFFNHLKMYFKLFLREAICIFIFVITFGFTGFTLFKNNFSVFSIVFITLLVCGILVFIYISIFYYDTLNINILLKKICTEEVKFKVVDTITSLSSRWDVPFSVFKSIYALFEYTYNKKKYQRIIFLSELKVFEGKKQLRIKVCKYFPRIIYVYSVDEK